MTSPDTSSESMKEDSATDPDSDADAAHDSAAAPKPDSSEGTTIRTGRNFETTYRLDATETGEFLIALGEQLRTDDELTLVGDDWELPFAFGEPIEVEIDFDGMGDPELEIELELPGRTDDIAPDVK